MGNTPSSEKSHLKHISRIPLSIRQLSGCPPTYIAGVNYEAIWKALRRARDEAGLTLDALAERSGLNRNMISAMEHGRKMPTIRTLARLVEAIPRADGGTLTLSTFFAQIETVTSSVTRRQDTLPRSAGSADVAQSLQASENRGGGESYVARGPVPATDPIDRVVARLETIAAKLDSVSSAVTERALNYVLADDRERDATTRVIKSGRSHPVPRQRRRKTGRS